MRLTVTILLVSCMVAAGAVQAASALRLPMPTQFGRVAAWTYDDGHRDGRAFLTMAHAPSGDVTLDVDIRLDNGARTQLRARMRPLPGGRVLRLIGERARTVRPGGSLVASLVVDHQRGVATCKFGGQPAQTLRLPAEDRVANVPLNLVLRPLVTGKAKRIAYQTLACGKDFRLVDTVARVVRRIPGADGRRGLVEVRCKFELGSFLSLLAGPFLPKLEFWFDADRSAAWVAHRTPLYSDGPTVLLVRRPLAPGDLEPHTQQASNTM